MNYLTDQEYKFIYERAVRFCLDFVIVKDGSVLLAKRDIEPCKGNWTLPGGMVRYKEGVDQASDRILQSEVGLKTSSKRLLGYMEFPNEVNQNGVRTHSVSIVFLIVLPKNNILKSDHTGEIKFFKSLPKENINSIHENFLKEHWGIIMH